MQRGTLSIPAKATAPSQLRVGLMNAGPNIQPLGVPAASSGPQPGAAAASNNSAAVAAAAQQAQQMAQSMTQQQLVMKELKKSWIDLMNDITKCSKHLRAAPGNTLDQKEKSTLQIRLMHFNSTVETALAFFDVYIQQASIELTADEYGGALFEHVNALSRIQAELAAARREIFGDES